MFTFQTVVGVKQTVNNSALTLCSRNKPEEGDRSCPRNVMLHYFIHFNTLYDIKLSNIS